jgi:uncharacterized DUF497 family protein
MLPPEGFEWDKAKSEANARAPGRGFGFLAVLPLFDGPVLEVRDGRKAYGEERIIAIGLVRAQCLVVVFTWRERPDGRGRNRRVISARFANRAERAAYRTWRAAAHPK